MLISILWLSGCDLLYGHHWHFMNERGFSTVSIPPASAGIQPAKTWIALF